MAILESRRNKLSIISFIRAGIIAGLISGLLNNGYVLIYKFYTHFSFKEFVNIKFVTGVSLGVGIAAGLLYFVIFRLSLRYNLIFNIVFITLTVVSLAVPYSDKYPDGTFKMEYDEFFWLTVPMHFISMGIIMWVLPSQIRRKLNEGPARRKPSSSIPL